MSDIVVALITIFGTVASVAGVVLYVFNGTKMLINEIHETQKEIKDIMKIGQQQHSDMIELMKKGFGEISHRQAT